MILRHIKIENFLSHEDVDLSFPKEGTFLLAGKSGIGKSSLIIDAIAYSLYGSVATRGKKQSDLKNSDAPSESMSVDTVWEFNDEIITFSRGVDKRNSSWAKAYILSGEETTIIAEGIKPVARVVLKRLGGMNWQQFYSAFVARQDEINLLTTLKGGQRKDLIHRMLGMRELEKSEQIITAKLRRLKATRDQLEKSVGGIDIVSEKEELKELEQELHSLNLESVKIKKEISDNNKLINDLENKVNLLKKDIDNLKKATDIKNKIKETENAMALLKDSADKDKSARQVLKDIPLDDLEKSLENLKDERQKLRNLFLDSKSLEKAIAEKETLNSEQRLLKDQIIAVFKNHGIDLKVVSPDMIQSKDNLKKDLDRNEQDLKIIADRIKNLSEKDQCYICQRKFSDPHDHKSLIEEVKAEYKTIEQEIIKTKSNLRAIDEADQLILQLKEVSGDIASKDSEIKILKERKGSLSTSSIKTRGVEIKSEVEKIEKQIESARKLQNDLNPDIAQSFTNNEKVKDDLEEELKKVPDFNPESENNFKKISDQKSSLGLELASLKASLDIISKNIVSKKQDITRKSKILLGLDHEFAELEKIKKEAEVAESVTLLIRGYQKQLTTEIRPAIEEIASEMITRISEGRHVGIKINDDYEISIEKASGSILPANMLSGGEEIRANICLRLALTRLVSQRTGIPVGFLILDEPLPAQDSDHIEKIMELLKSLRVFYRQQFIISHVGELKNDDSVDYLIEFDKTPSGKTLVNMSYA